MNKRRRGFTIVETIMAATLLTMLLGAIVVFTNAINRLSTNHNAAAVTLGKSRVSVDQVVRDARAADLVMGSFGGYASDRDTTLILRLPKKANGGDLLEGEWDVVVYKLEAGSGPRVLHRYLGSIIAGSQITPTLDSTISSSVASVAFEYMAVESFDGDGVTRQFNLSTTLDSTSTAEVEIEVGADDQISAGNATYSPTAVTFSAPPASGDQIDVSYPVSPSDTSRSGGNFAGRISLTIRPYISVQSSRHAESSRTQTVKTEVTLRNQSL